MSGKKLNKKIILENTMPYKPREYAIQIIKYHQPPFKYFVGLQEHEE